MARRNRAELRTRAERWSEGREGGGAKDVPPEEVGAIEEGSVLMHFAGFAELGSRPPGTDRSGRLAAPFEWRSDAGRSSLGASGVQGLGPPQQTVPLPR